MTDHFIRLPSGGNTRPWPVSLSSLWRCCFSIMAGALLLAEAPVLAGGNNTKFALGDGDTLVFLGDSITAARGYTKVVELYTLMRHPEARVRFWNAG